MAGLAAAADLAVAGHAVTLLDRQAAAGGKMSRAVVAGRVMDAGPTVLTLVPLVAQLFADAGFALEEMVTLQPVERLARHFWPDGSALDLFANARRTADAIAAFASPSDARGYLAFAAASRRLHEALRQTFMEADKPASPLSLLWRGGIAGLPGFARLDPYRSLAAMIASHVADPRLQQLLGRYATYCGSSPYRAPATLALIADTERAGVWQVEGGMARLAEAMLSLAGRLGVTVRFGADVAEVMLERGRARAVRLAGGEVIRGDAVVIAADTAALAAGRFGREAARAVAPLPPRDRSFSAFTVATVARTGSVPLGHHSVFFSANARAEFDALAAGRMPANPTVYVCAQDRGEAETHVPDVPERLLMVLNAPADGDTHIWTEEEREQCLHRAFTRLRNSGLTLDPVGCSTSTSSDFERRFPATGGALYGRASHGWTASFRRPGARTRVPGLFLAGGSTHPGAGVPMAILSGRAAARAILASAPVRASTLTSRRAVTPGGISTPSATTAATA